MDTQRTLRDPAIGLSDFHVTNPKLGIIFTFDNFTPKMDGRPLLPEMCSWLYTHWSPFLAVQPSEPQETGL